MGFFTPMDQRRLLDRATTALEEHIISVDDLLEVVKPRLQARRRWTRPPARVFKKSLSAKRKAVDGTKPPALP